MNQRNTLEQWTVVDRADSRTLPPVDAWVRVKDQDGTLFPGYGYRSSEDAVCWVFFEGSPPQLLPTEISAWCPYVSEPPDARS